LTPGLRAPAAWGELDPASREVRLMKIANVDATIPAVSITKMG